MALTFSWHREKIDARTYAENMGILNEDKDNESPEFKISIDKKENGYSVTVGQDLLSSLSDSSKLSNAYKVAADIRKFEIDKYWQRTLYFWGFITAIYVAYYNVFKEMFKAKHGEVPLLILSALGLFFCFSWLLASKGSKHWQENWENHLDMLEDNITGPIYKTYKAGNSFSVSKINIVAGIVLSLCAYGLLLFEFASFVQGVLFLDGLLAFAFSAVFMIVVAVSLFVYAQFVKGNAADFGSISFDFKKYGEICEESK